MNALKTLPLAALLLLLSSCAAFPNTIMSASGLAPAKDQQQQRDWQAESDRLMREAAERRAAQERIHEDVKNSADTAIDPELIGSRLAGHREARAMYVVFNLAHRRHEAQLAKENARDEREQRRYEQAERARRAQQRSSSSSYGGYSGGGKVCSKGCRCGNSCISCKKTCRK